MLNPTKSIVFTAFRLPPSPEGLDRPRLRPCIAPWPGRRAQDKNPTFRHEDHGVTGSGRYRSDVRPGRRRAHDLEPARPLAPPRAPWRGDHPAACLRCRARRHRRRAGGDLRPAGAGQHLGGDPRHRAHHPRALGYPLADHRALVPGVHRRDRDAGLDRPSRATPDSRAPDGCGRAGRAGRLPPARGAPGLLRRAPAHIRLRRLQPALPRCATGHRHCGRTGGPALPEPSHASPGDRRRLDRRPLRGGRCLRSPARCHRRGDCGVGHGGRLPPRDGRAQRAPLRGRGNRCGARSASRSARAYLHGAPGVGRGVLCRHGHGKPAARTRGLRARRR